MTREKIKNHVLSDIRSGAASMVTRIALDTMVPALALLHEREEFMAELAWECDCNVTPWEDGGYLFRYDWTVARAKHEATMEA